jgi:hypothetical protein
MAFFIPTDYAPVIQELKQRLAMVETTIQVLEEIQNEESVKPPAAGARAPEYAPRTARPEDKHEAFLKLFRQSYGICPFCQNDLAREGWGFHYSACIVWDWAERFANAPLPPSADQKEKKVAGTDIREPPDETESGKEQN